MSVGSDASSIVEERRARGRKRKKPGPLSSKKRTNSSDESRETSAEGSVTVVVDDGVDLGFFVGSGDECYNTPPAVKRRGQALAGKRSQSSSLERRGRGRPPSTGEYVGLAKAKNEAALAEEKLLQIEEMKRILDPASELSTSVKEKIKRKVEKVLEEAEQNSTPDLAAMALESIKSVVKVSTTSQGLKGTLQGTLKNSAATLNAVVHLLAKRAQLTPEEKAENEVKALREELRASRAQVTELVKQVEELRGMVACGLPKSGSTPAAKKPAKKGKVPVTAGVKEAGNDGEGGKNTREEASLPPPYSDSEEPTKVEMPPQEDWPPVLRPEVAGRRKEILKRGEADLPRNPPPSCREKMAGLPTQREEGAPPKDMGELLQKLKTHMEGLLEERFGKKSLPKEGRGNLPPPLPLSRGTEPGGTGGGRGKTKGKGGTGVEKVPSQPPATSAAVKQPLRPDQETWAVVAGRGRAARDKARQPKETKGTPPNKEKGAKKKVAPPKGATKEGKQPPKKGASKKKRTPNSAAVTITCPPGRYEEVIREARGKIDLASLKIDNLRPKRAVTGAIIYEVAGEGGATKADELAAKLRQVFAGKEEVRVARPVKMTEMRVSGLDDSARKEEIAEAIVAMGGGDLADVRVGEIRKAPNGLASAWIKCPLVVANKVSTRGKIRVGWVTARAEVLEERPLRCFRCLRKGHVRASCTSEVDRSGLCYRCGEPGHVAQLCGGQPRCVLCAEAGLQHNHRVGAKSCKAPTRERRGEGEKPRKKAIPVKGEKGKKPSPLRREEEKMEVEEERCPALPPTPLRKKGDQMDVDPPTSKKEAPKEKRPLRITSVQTVEPTVILRKLRPREEGAGGK